MPALVEALTHGFNHRRGATKIGFRMAVTQNFVIKEIGDKSSFAGPVARRILHYGLPFEIRHAGFKYYKSFGEHEVFGFCHAIEKAHGCCMLLARELTRNGEHAGKTCAACHQQHRSLGIAQIKPAFAAANVE